MNDEKLIGAICTWIEDYDTYGYMDAGDELMYEWVTDDVRTGGVLAKDYITEGTKEILEAWEGADMSEPNKKLAYEQQMELYRRGLKLIHELDGLKSRRGLLCIKPKSKKGKPMFGPAEKPKRSRK